MKYGNPKTATLAYGGAISSFSAISASPREIFRTKAMTAMNASRPLLILDLDETLVHATEERLDIAHDFVAGPYVVYKRPHLTSFLEAAAELYRLAVWSSSSFRYFSRVVNHILPADVTLEFRWSRSRCVRNFDHEQQEQIWLKDLRKVKRAGYDLERVLIVDDQPEKLSRSYGNAIYVSPFTGDPSDDELPALLEYLTLIADKPNFRSIEKRRWRSKVERHE